MENLISIEVAEKEWSEFLTDNDAQSLIPKLENKDSSIKEDKEEYENKLKGFSKMTRAISKGIVIIDNGIITQALQQPIVSSDGQKVVEKLVYDKRWTAKDREDILKGIDTKQTDQSLMAQRRLCAKLTGIDFIILGKIDMVDSKITDLIVSVFFM